MDGIEKKRGLYLVLLVFIENKGVFQNKGFVFFLLFWCFSVYRVERPLYLVPLYSRNIPKCLYSRSTNHTKKTLTTLKRKKTKQKTKTKERKESKTKPFKERKENKAKQRKTNKNKQRKPFKAFSLLKKDKKKTKERKIK